MRKTVFGIFGKASDAQTAVKGLLDEGFSEREIHVHRSREGDEVSGTETGSTPKERNSDGYPNFLSNLIVDNEEAKRYSDAARNGSVVTVNATSQNESERAAEVLNRFGASNVREGDVKDRKEGA